MPRIIAICGMDWTSGRDLMNELPDNVEGWFLNEDHLFLRRPLVNGRDRWFQLHERIAEGRFDTSRGEKGAKEHEEFLHFCPVPIYMLKKDPAIPNSLAYPFDEVVKVLETQPYFSSAMDYMLALALYEHKLGQAIEEIQVNGISLAFGIEQLQQKQSFEHWLGMARGMDIKIVLPEGCQLLIAPLYGRSDPMEFRGRLEGRYVSLLAHLTRTEGETNMLSERLQEVAFLMANPVIMTGRYGELQMLLTQKRDQIKGIALRLDEISEVLKLLGINAATIPLPVNRKALVDALGPAGVRAAMEQDGHHAELPAAVQ